MGVRVVLVLFIYLFFIFSCFRHVLGLIFDNFSLFCFLACLKIEACSLCTGMFAFGNIMI